MTWYSIRTSDVYVQHPMILSRSQELHPVKSILLMQRSLIKQLFSTFHPNRNFVAHKLTPSRSHTYLSIGSIPITPSLYPSALRETPLRYHAPQQISSPSTLHLRPPNYKHIIYSFFASTRAIINPYPTYTHKYILFFLCIDNR